MPTFLSFRRPGAEKESPEKAEPEKKADSRDRERASSKHRHGSSKDKKKSGDQDHDPSSASEGSHGTVKEISSGDTSFIIDTKGDRQNVVYKSVYAGEIPPYQRFGFGRVLGLDRSQRIDRSTKDDKSLLISDPATFREQRPDRYNLPKVPGRAKLIVPRMVNEAERAETLRSSYIAFDSDEDPNTAIEDQAIVASLRHPEPSQSWQPASAENNVQGDSEGELLRKRATLQKLIKLEPGELQHWLDLAATHDEIVRQGRTSLSRGEEQGLAEVKLSYYEKALKEPSLTAQDRLTLAKLFMTEVEKVYDVKVQMEKWQEILKEPRISIELWANYLEFIQTRPSKWILSDARSALDRAREAIRGYITAGKGSLSLEEIETSQGEMEVYRLLRLTLMMKAAGFTEGSIAIWQAILEFFFLPHRHYESDGNTKLDYDVVEQFRAFWDDERPRVGEPGFRGKVSFNRSGSEREAEDPSKDNLPDQAASVTSWYKAERLAQLQNQLPARISQEDVTDPYRIVLSDDIAGQLSFISFKASKHLLDGFLAFCGLPPAGWATDSFTSTLLTDTFVRVGSSEFTRTPDSTSFSSTLPIFQFGCFYPDVGGLHLAADTWPGFELSPGSENKAQLLSLVRDVLETLLWNGHPRLAVYLMLFDSVYFPREAAATAKRLLKKLDQNLPLYCAYALFERRRGKTKRSEGIFEAATGMIPQLPTEEARNAIVLYRRWAWELMVENRLEDALRVLEKGWQTILSTGEYEELAQQASSLIYKPFELGRENMLREGRLDLAMEFQICNAYHQYLSSDADLKPALAAFKYGSQLLLNRNQASSAEHEKLQQAKAVLLYNHTALRTSYKPALLRDEISESLAFFPNNTILLSLARWIESKVGIEDRLRSKLLKSLHDPSSESIIRILCSIWMEQTASRGIGYNSNSLRAAFKRAVASPVAKHNAAVWKMFFQFEAREGALDKARTVFFDGVRACPWEKDLVLLAFELEGSVFTAEQLKDIYRSAVERGLRFHIDYEEFDSTR